MRKDDFLNEKLQKCFAYIKENNLKSEISSGDLLYIEKTDCFIYKVTPFDTVKSVFGL